MCLLLGNVMFEKAIEQSLFSVQSEKSFLDKLLAKDDNEKIRELIKKPRLNRSELLELMYMLSSTEAKLVNYSEWDRYIILKFFVWIREFIQVAELLYDYKDDLSIKERTCSECGKSIPGKIGTPVDEPIAKCNCLIPVSSLILSDKAKKLLKNNERYIEHNAKFLIDLYLNIARTTLSLGGTAFLEGLTNKFELSYPNQSIVNPQMVPTDQPQKKIQFRR